jgi:hypothetical protein
LKIREDSLLGLLPVLFMKREPISHR